VTKSKVRRSAWGAAERLLPIPSKCIDKTALYTFAMFGRTNDVCTLTSDRQTGAATSRKHLMHFWLVCPLLYVFFVASFVAIKIRKTIVQSTPTGMTSTVGITVLTTGNRNKKRFSGQERKILSEE
jgi:hypothetical protein